MIRDAQVKTFGFIHLNNSWVYKKTDDPDKYVDLAKFTELLGPLPDVILTNVGAQFIVSRERIRAHTLEFYKGLFKVTKSKLDATSLEHLWHVIFGEPAVMYAYQPFFDPPMDIYVLPSDVVPDAHKIVLYMSSEAPVNYPLARVVVSESPPTNDFNAVSVKVYEDHFIFREPERKFPIDKLAEFYIDILKQSMFHSVKKDDWASYHAPLFRDFFPKVTYVGVPPEHRLSEPSQETNILMVGPNCDILRTLVLSRSEMSVVILDNYDHDETMQKAFQLFSEWYKPIIRIILVDELLIFINLKTSAPQDQTES